MADIIQAQIIDAEIVTPSADPVAHNMPGGGAVESVNGKTGAVVLTADDVGAVAAETFNAAMQGKQDKLTAGTGAEIKDGVLSTTTLGITGAAVGQIARITAVDSDGKPTAWEPVDLPSGKDGADGKPAYQYAVEGGYTGTETEFSEKLAQEQLTGTTNNLTPTQVYEAVSAGIPVKVQYTSGAYGLLSFTAFNVAESLNIIVSQTIVYYQGVYVLCELYGDKSNNTWGFSSTTLAQKTDIPTVLHNPNALTFTGAATGSYDGSAAMTVNIPSGGGENALRLIVDTTTTEDVAQIEFTEDIDGNPLKLKKFIFSLEVPAATGVANATIGACTYRWLSGADTPLAETEGGKIVKLSTSKTTWWGEICMNIEADGKYAIFYKRATKTPYSNNTENSDGGTYHRLDVRYAPYSSGGGIYYWHETIDRIFYKSGSTTVMIPTGTKIRIWGVDA